jgi:hypothetical protein
MRYDFYTDKYGFRQMEYPEVKELEVGDKIAVCVYMELPKKIEFVDAVVVTPMFWNSNADEKGWEVETDIGFVDIHDIYEVAEL